MHVLLIIESPIPVVTYGGTERVVWDLGRQLVRQGHQVTYLAPEGSTCDFARTIFIRPGVSWADQVPDGVDLAHFHAFPRRVDDFPPVPWLMTQHGYTDNVPALPRNTIFVSQDHAARHGATAFVHNGLDWSTYGGVEFERARSHFHFLGKARWRLKNVRGAIDVARNAGVQLLVMGGSRLNIKSGFRFTWSPQVRFAGLVGGAQKLDMLNSSRGLIFPVLWHEPFGLAVTESLYFGCPIFATPYGALRELVPESCGVLSASRSALAEAVRDKRFDASTCHQHALNNFSAERMAQGYLTQYARVLDGGALNDDAPILAQPFKHLDWLA